jgi:uncharacterized protein YidB (DUF937 family)
MGLLGQILGSALGSSSGPTNEISALEGVVDLIQHPSVGGVEGLASKFQSAGLGHIAQGWIGNGQNPPVTTSQLTQVLGSGPIAAFAQKLGIPPDQAAQHLTQLLPQVINELTPNGSVPAASAAPTASSEILNLLKSKFL